MASTLTQRMVLFVLALALFTHSTHSQVSPERNTSTDTYVTHTTVTTISIVTQTKIEHTTSTVPSTQTNMV